MAQRRHHYERAFEEHLRRRRIPYIAVHEGRKALLPLGISSGETDSLKSFDFVVHAEHANLLVDIKGRRLAPARDAIIASRPRSLQTWATRDDLRSLRRWQELCGERFIPMLVFLYASPLQPADGHFAEVFEYQGTWYAIRAITVDAYERHMKERSKRWGTVDLARDDFERLCERILEPAVPAGVHH